MVYAAALLTWIGATGTAAFTLLLTVSLLLLGAPIFDTFRSGRDNPRWFIVEAAGVVIALSAAAALSAVFLTRRHQWARWVLILLSVVAAVGSVMLAYYIGPLLVTAAAVAVLVLLSLPRARAWFRTPHPPPAKPA